MINVYGVTTQNVNDMEGVIADPLKGVAPSMGAIGTTVLQQGLLGAGSTGESIDQFQLLRELQQEPEGFWAGLNTRYGGLFVGDKTRQGEPITKEQWAESEFYREGLEYREGMTDIAADILARRRDMEDFRNGVLQRATGLQTGAFYAGMLVTSMADAKTVPATLAGLGAVKVGAAGYGAVRAGMASGSIAAARTGAIVSSKAAMGTKRAIAAEAVIGTIPVAATGFAAARDLQTEYTLEDAAIDTVASAVVAVGLNTAFKGLGKMWLSWRTPDDMEAVAKLVDAQMRAGDAVNIEGAVQTIMASKEIPLSTVPKSERVPTVTKVGNKFEARVKGEDGLMSVAVGRGKTEAEATADLLEQYQTARAGENYDNTMPPEYWEAQVRWQEARDNYEGFNTEEAVRIELEQQGIDIDAARVKIAEMRRELDELRKTRGEGKVKKAEQRLEREQENLRAKVQEVSGRVAGYDKSLKAQVDALGKMVTEMQVANNKKQLSAYVAKETDPDISVTNGDGVVAAVKSPEVMPKVQPDKAAGATGPAPDRKRIEQRLLSDNIPDDVKARIKSELDAIDDLRNMSDNLEAFMRCKGY